MWWRAFGARRQPRSSGLSTLSASRNWEKLTHWTCVELVSASVNSKKITNVWLHKGVIFKNGKTSGHELHSQFVFICVVLGTGAGVGPRNGESVTAVSKGSEPVQPWWDSPSSLCCFYFENGEGSSHNAILSSVVAISGFLDSTKVAIDTSSRTAESYRLSKYLFFPPCEHLNIWSCSWLNPVLAHRGHPLTIWRSSRSLKRVNHPEEVNKERRCLLWGYVGHNFTVSETQEICSLTLTSTGFSFTEVVISILYFCATLFQFLVKNFWKNVTVQLSGVNSCKSLGLSRWHEVGMDLMRGCGHHISTGMALLLPRRSGGGQGL